MRLLRHNREKNDKRCQLTDPQESECDLVFHLQYKPIQYNTNSECSHIHSILSSSSAQLVLNSDCNLNQSLSIFLVLNLDLDAIVKLLRLIEALQHFNQRRTTTRITRHHSLQHRRLLSCQPLLGNQRDLIVAILDP